MSTLIKIIVTSCLALLSSSCVFVTDGIKGEGPVTRKEHTPDTRFEAIKVSNGIQVIISKSTSSTIVVEANENLHPHIMIRVTDGILHISSDKNIYKADEKTVYVPYDSLHTITASSGAAVSAQETVVAKDIGIKTSSGASVTLNVKSEKLKSTASSGAQIQLSGTTNYHKAKASSGAHLNTKKLIGHTVEAHGSSGSYMSVYASSAFTGKATSGADVLYYGTPEKVTTDDNSGGNVRKK